MFVISTRNFPPEIGGMQNLMGGLANALINHGPVKVFADKSENFEKYDNLSKAEIERFGGVKLLRKYRKANRVAEYIKNNQNIRSIFFDHWKSVEKINVEIIKNIPTFCLIHSKEINHAKGSGLNKRVLNSLKKIKYVIANSNFTKNYPEDSFENMVSFSKKNGFIFPYLIDETQEVAKKYGAVCTPDFFGYNNKLELQYRGRIRELKDLKSVRNSESDLLKAMHLVIKTGNGPQEQIPSMGCNIKLIK